MTNPRDWDDAYANMAYVPGAEALPELWAELARRGWTSEQLEGAQGENYMRVWTQVQATADGASAKKSDADE